MQRRKKINNVSEIVEKEGGRKYGLNKKEKWGKRHLVPQKSVFVLYISSCQEAAGHGARRGSNLFYGMNKYKNGSAAESRQAAPTSAKKREGAL